MATGVPVLASDVPSVRELIAPGVNGLLEPFFDVERLAAAALRVLDDPAAAVVLGREARRTIEDRYGLDRCIPPLRDFFVRVVEGTAREG
jgi:glycosyltransferase involved in cell wall biosynthesis